MKPSDIEKNWKKDLEKRGVLKQSKNIFWVVYRKGLFICFSKNKTDAMEEALKLSRYRWTYPTFKKDWNYLVKDGYEIKKSIIIPYPITDEEKNILQKLYS